MRCRAAISGIPFILAILAIDLATTPAFSQPPVVIASAVATTGGAATVMRSAARPQSQARSSYFESYLDEVSARGSVPLAWAEQLQFARVFDPEWGAEISLGHAANSFNQSFNARVVDLLEYDTPVRVGQSDMIFKLRAPGSDNDIVTFELIF